MDKENGKYKDCYVAFIDILGFKNIVSGYGCDFIEKIFNDILCFKPEPMVDLPEVFSNVKHYVMSDSVVLYIEADIKDSFMALVEFCYHVQIMLANRPNPILVRGGVVRGNIYHKGNVLFGTGLTNAYMLENSLAKYPRIVFTEETRRNAINENTDALYVLDYNKMLYRKDEDMVYYVNYLHIYGFIRNIKPKNHDEYDRFENEYYYNLLKLIESQLDGNTEISVREKYLWLYNKTKKAIDCNPSTKAFFEDLREKEKKNVTEKFDAAVESLMRRKMGESSDDE